MYTYGGGLSQAASIEGDAVLRSSLVPAQDRAPRPGLYPVSSGAAMNSRRTGRLSWQTMRRAPGGAPAKEPSMARVNTYLNFQGETEEAFAFYAETFGTEVTMLSRYSDMPAVGPGQLPAEEQNLVLHAELPILAGHVLMATDMLRSMGQETRIGNNTTLCLDVDSREEADRLYGALSEDGSEGSPMADMPWGAYWGVILDRYGIRWMFNHTPAT
jgi:PhnB protein